MKGTYVCDLFYILLLLILTGGTSVIPGGTRW